jgi:hypothetical protein
MEKSLIFHKYSVAGYDGTCVQAKILRIGNRRIMSLGPAWAKLSMRVYIPQVEGPEFNPQYHKKVQFKLCTIR